MISGKVTSGLSPIVRLRVLSPDQQQNANIDAIVDTGFNGFLALPHSAVHALELEPHGVREVILADGSIARTEICRAMARWDGRLRRILVNVTDGDPLIGTSLLHGFQLRVDVVEGADVRIEKLSRR